MGTGKTRLTVLALSIALGLSGIAFAATSTNNGSTISDADAALIRSARAHCQSLADRVRASNNRADAAGCISDLDQVLTPAATSTTTVAPTTAAPTTAPDTTVAPTTVPPTTATVPVPTTCTTTIAPGASITSAANALASTGTLCLRGGVYNQTVTLQRGVVMSYPGETAIIDGTGIALARTSDLINVNGSATLAKVEVRNVSGRAIRTLGAGKVIQNRIHDVQYNGILAAGTGAVIDGNEVWNTVLSNTNGLVGSSGWAEAINTWYGHNTTIINNYVHDNWGEGIDFISSQGGRAAGNQVCNNYSVGIYVDGSSNVVVDGNRVGSTTALYDRGFGPAWGVLVASEGGGAIANISVTNNRWTRVSGPVSTWNVPSSVVTQSGNQTITNACG